MRKLLGTLAILIFVFSLTACGSGKATIEDGKITENTLAFNQDGTVEMGMVSDFTKDYYDFDELETFVDESIETYTKANGADTVKKLYCKEDSGKAFITLSFSSIEHYNKYNSEEAYLMKLSDAKKAGVLPQTLYSASDNSTIDPETIEDNDYSIAILNSKYQIIVQGKIMYHVNGAILNDNTIESEDEKQTIILFK